MNADLAWAPWAMVILGAWHGLNPGMGWLFAVALGMQEKRARAVWRALPPLAAGHAAAVGVWVVLAVVLGFALPEAALRGGVAALLVGYGLFRFVRPRHPSFGGMRMGGRELTTWSFLMATAHGAGLMVLPFLSAFLPAGLGSAGGEGMGAGAAAGAGGGAHAHHGVVHAAAVGPEGMEAWTAVLLHTGSYLLVTGALALLVVGWLGLRWLRAFWVDLDRVWAAALVATGIFTLVL
jgi:hypothetical protein